MPSKTNFFVVVVRGNSLELMGSKDCSPLWWGEWGGGGGGGWSSSDALWGQELASGL